MVNTLIEKKRVVAKRESSFSIYFEASNWLMVDGLPHHCEVSVNAVLDGKIVFGDCSSSFVTFRIEIEAD